MAALTEPDLRTLVAQYRMTVSRKPITEEKLQQLGQTAETYQQWRNTLHLLVLRGVEDALEAGHWGDRHVLEAVELIGAEALDIVSMSFSKRSDEHIAKSAKFLCDLFVRLNRRRAGLRRRCLTQICDFIAYNFDPEDGTKATKIILAFLREAALHDSLRERIKSAFLAAYKKRIKKHGLGIESLKTLLFLTALGPRMLADIVRQLDDQVFAPVQVDAILKRLADESAGTPRRFGRRGRKYLRKMRLKWASTVQTMDKLIDKR